MIYDPSIIEISHRDCGGLLGDLVESIIICSDYFCDVFFPASSFSPFCWFGLSCGFLRRGMTAAKATFSLTPKALSDASMRVPYPAAISKVLEAAREAQVRAEIPASERV